MFNKLYTSAAGLTKDLAALALWAFIIFLATAMIVALVDEGERGKRAMHIFDKLLALLLRDDFRRDKSKPKKQGGNKQDRGKW